MLLGGDGALAGRDRARLIAFVPQEPVLPPDMTVAEYVLLGRTPYVSYLGGPGRSDRVAAERAASRLGVSVFAGRRLASLSGGERKRVVLVLLHQGRIEAAGPAAAVLTEDRIARVYGAHVAVRTDPDEHHRHPSPATGR